jgi:NAD(P)-dependent dehydrogenase (short-subunit alcohol dehydrogenase family)
MSALDGRHALITGGGTGIGAAIAAALGSSGVRLSIAGRRHAPLEAMAASFPGTCVIEADVTREADCAAMVEAAHAAHGPIDIVIANAGGAESRSISRADREHWQRMLDVNLTGAFLTVKAALPDLVRSGSADVARRIVFVSSTAGLKGYPYVAAYCAAKHGVIGLARALALELARTGVTVNAVCPGFTETPLLDQSIANIVAKSGRSADDARAALSAGNPQGRFVRPEEVAASVLWLCMPASSSVTGQAISISGGEV